MAPRSCDQTTLNRLEDGPSDRSHTVQSQLGVSNDPSPLLQTDGSIVQGLRARNSLGQLKFEMLNPYAVSSHDNPVEGDFSRSTTSSRATGCVRVENTLALAALLLQEPGSGGADIGRLTHGEYLPTNTASGFYRPSDGLGRTWWLRSPDKPRDWGQLLAYPPLSRPGRDIAARNAG